MGALNIFTRNKSIIKWSCILGVVAGIGGCIYSEYDYRGRVETYEGNAFDSEKLLKKAKSEAATYYKLDTIIKKRQEIMGAWVTSEINVQMYGGKHTTEPDVRKDIYPSKSNLELIAERDEQQRLYDADCLELHLYHYNNIELDAEYRKYHKYDRPDDPSYLGTFIGIAILPPGL